VTDSIADTQGADSESPFAWARATRACTATDCEAAALAQSRYRQRRLRGHYFGEELFRDPAWDLLLDLYIADFQGKRITVTSACCAAGVPAPTGLRWIAKLEEKHFVRRCREVEAEDGRLVYVEITPSARSRMTELLRRFELY
jgi:hypothetical protein